jgi:hypothetical protein
MSQRSSSPDPPTGASGADVTFDAGRPELSIVLPIFNEEAVLDELH